jgi:putative YphP/YqiW family bacilliredoxin
MASMYDRNLVKPMWQELEQVGVTPLSSAREVDRFMSEAQGTALIMVNSVCGCAAGSARPALALALQNEVIPDQLATVFAGVDTEATDRARSYMKGVPPSSPSIALFKDGKLVYMMERVMIEGHRDEQVASELKNEFNKYCLRQGPSVPWERVVEVFGVQQSLGRIRR